jgi:hypothetical protein
MWRRKTAQRRSRLRFSVAPNARTGHFSVTVCYVPLCFCNIFYKPAFEINDWETSWLLRTYADLL